LVGDSKSRLPTLFRVGSDLILSRGGTPYDVAKVLGDTIETIERHYTPFVRELRERVRRLLETGVGMEEMRESAGEMQSKPN
jgi:hypothetical protein